VITQSRQDDKQTTENPLFRNDDSALVESLLDHTSSLMESHAKHIVAYSGGVDSSLVLALLRQLDPLNVQAVLGISPAVSQDQIQLARSVASHLDSSLTEVLTEEGTDPVYIANAGQACRACKTHLYSSLEAVFRHTTNNTTNENDVVLYNGTNADDLEDPTRVGLLAARDFRVQSPLRYISKTEVRRAARYLGLPNWNVAASPCLRSRLALGVHATRQHLQMIEEAERIVRQSLSSQLHVGSNVRVRFLTQQRARVEVDRDCLDEAQRYAETTWKPIFERLGFVGIPNVSLFKSGSVATNKQREEEVSP